MARRILLTLLVLVLGLKVTVPPSGTGWSMNLDGPAVALLVYGALLTVTLLRLLDHLPGVLALRAPLGRVRTGYEYLWAPAIVAVLAGFTYTGVLEGRTNPDERYWTAVYGQSQHSWLPFAAFGAFVLLMWALKLDAAMREANRRLASV